MEFKPTSTGFTAEPVPASRTRGDIEAEAADLLPLFEQYPDIVYTKSDPAYDSLAILFNKALNIRPLAILRPSNQNHVREAVKIVSAAGLRLAIRAGGLDMSGKNVAGIDDAGVLLDLRSMNSTEIAEDKLSATVGGGILIGDLIPALAARDLFTPIGWHPMVGYCGWAMGGGYGLYASSYGLGSDQIVAAQVVLADGSIVIADDSNHTELLWALRGAGNGLWGVVTQLTVKVYPQPKALIGALTFPKKDWPAVMNEWAENFEPSLPHEYTGDVYIRNPVPESPELALFFAWCPKEGDDLGAGYAYLERLKALPGTPTYKVGESKLQKTHRHELALWLTNVSLVTPAEWVGMVPSSQSVPIHVRGAITPGLTKAVAAVLIDQYDKIGPLYMGFPSHFLHGKAIEPNPAACFPLRFRHRLFPLTCSHIDITTDAVMDARTKKFAEQVITALKATGEVLPGVAYGNLIPVVDADAEATFGAEALARLRKLKAEYDPHSFFGNGYPVL